MAHKETLMALATISALCDGPYSHPLQIPKMTNQSRRARTTRTYGTDGCAVCKRTHVTLVKRVGMRFCRDCAAKIEGGNNDDD